jgi:hypothetical protein
MTTPPAPQNSNRRFIVIIAGSILGIAIFLYTVAASVEISHTGAAADIASIHPMIAFWILPAILISLYLGRRLRTHHPTATVSGAIEGAVFALFGLLLAFTFSGALTRYDDHRKLIVEEANDIGTAYRRLDLLPADSQPALRTLFREYAETRQHNYDGLPTSTQTIEASRKVDKLQDEIWSRSVTAAALPTASPDATKLLVPSLNAMIDITATRKNAFNMHPPIIVFVLLFFFSIGCAFMAGYGMNPLTPTSLWSIALALSVTLTVYTTLEVEYPRRGLIHLTSQNEVFPDLINSMK